MAVGRLVALILEVADLPASRAFYGGLLGLPLHEGADNEADGDRWISGEHAAISWSQGAFFHFALYAAKEAPTRAAQIGFQVEDLAAMHARLIAAGVEAAHGPRQQPWGLSARYYDPDRNVVELTQPPKR
ncbi:MAG: VOC family protein [Caulobacterales bacterium]